MALLIEKPWRTQPLGNVSINWNNPLTRGLVTTVLPYSSNSTFAVNRYTPFGVAGQLSKILSVADSDRMVSQGTIFGLLNYTGITFSIYELIFSIYQTTTWPTDSDRVLLTAGSGSTSEATVVSKNSGTVDNNGRTIKTSGTFATVMTYPNGVANGALYENGIFQTSVPHQGVTRPFATGKARTLTAKSAYMLAAWDRQLVPREIAELSRNPWQLFQPQNIQLNSPPAPRIYYVAGPNATWATPTSTEIINGQLAGGGAATASWSESAPLQSTNPFNFSQPASPLTTGTKYRAAAVQKAGDSNVVSNVVMSDPFLAGAATLSNPEATDITSTTTKPKVTVSY